MSGRAYLVLGLTLGAALEATLTFLVARWLRRRLRKVPHYGAYSRGVGVHPGTTTLKLHAVGAPRSPLVLGTAWASYVERLERTSPDRLEFPERWGWCGDCERLVPTAQVGAPCPVCGRLLTKGPTA